MCRIYRPAVARASAIFASNSSAVQVENETAMSDRRTKSERESAGQFYLTGVLDISPLPTSAPGKHHRGHLPSPG